MACTEHSSCAIQSATSPAGEIKYRSKIYFFSQYFFNICYLVHLLIAWYRREENRTNDRWILCLDLVFDLLLDKSGLD